MNYSSSVWRYFRAEFNTNSHGQFSRVVAEDSDLYVAIDRAQDDLFDVPCIKEKIKKEDLWRRGAQTIKHLHMVLLVLGRKLKRLK